MEVRTDRIGVLVEQLLDSKELSAERVTGLTRDEYLWEPHDGMWSLRRRGESATPHAFGPGDWVLDHDTSISPFDPGPLTTIAWRIAHLTSGFAGRWEWTFGTRSVEPKEMVEFTPDADIALHSLWGWVESWAKSVDSMTDEQLEVPGFGTYPYGLDPQIPFIGIVRWVNREFIHHMAEVALMRDLYAARARDSAL
ncbi:MAG TPA: DinB family protein [Ilumatobacteraceae bacterium]|nr:DinB family protein [Ilumatobacteraceae bacterium]